MPTTETAEAKAPNQRILRRYTGAILFEGAYGTMPECVEAAVERGLRLCGADLRGADLKGADLREADLRSANLNRATLRDADLRDADLSGADLASAYLCGADLRGADLSRANLTSADFSRADLRGADLRGADLARDEANCADLRDANLRGANLRSFRTDLFDVLLRALPEVPGVLAALRAGNVDSSGSCAGLVGIIANVRGVGAESIGYFDVNRPAEQWFMAICKGDTPATNAAAKMVEEWIADFQALVPAARGEAA